MRTPTAAPQTFVRFIILVLALGILAGTGYAWRTLTRSVHAYAYGSIEARTNAHSAAASAAYASAPLSLDPGQARFHPHVNLSNTGGQTSNLSDVAFAGNKVFVAWHEMGAASEVRFRASTNGGASFANSPSGQVLATIPNGDTLFSVQVAAFGNTVHVIYSSGASEATAQVSYRSSINNGVSFSSPVILAGGPGGSPFPDIATDGAGNVQVVLEDRGGTNDIHHRLSTDGGLTFGIAVNISNTGDESIKPRIAANGANIGVVWQENGSGGSEVQFIHSTDGGLSWPGPSQNLSNSAGTDSTSPDIGYGNSIQVVWAEGLSVAHRSSADLGATFSALANVATAAAGESIRGPRGAANGLLAGIIWMTADSSNVIHGPFLRRSEDGGATFAAAQDVANGLAGAGVDPAAIAAAPSLRIVWSRSLSGNATDAEVLFAREISCSVYWANPVNGNFATAANWSTGVVPTSASDVCIQVDGDYTVTSSAGRTINSLVVGDPDNTGSQTLQISGSTLTVLNGALNSSSGTLGLENITGTVASTLSVQNGVLTNIGTVDVNQGTGGLRNITADLVNDGTVNINANTSFNNGAGVYTNNSILNIAAGRTLSITGSNFNRQTFNQNGGTLNIAGAFNLTSFVTFNFNGGSITGIPVISTGTLNIGPGSTGAAEFSMRGAGNTLSGDIAPAQTVNINANTTSPVTLTAVNSFTNAGTINLETVASTGPSNLQVNSGVLTNTGTINVKPGTGGGRSITASFVNDGTINLDANTSFNDTNGVYTNNNILNIAAASTLSMAGGTISNSQTFRQNSGAITGGGNFNLTNATFFGRGNVTANLSLVNSNMNPGASPGVLNITGNYTQDSASDLFIELGGTLPGTGFDQLNISGTATLSGRLNVSVINGHCPEGIYEFMTFGSRVGDFTTKTGLTTTTGHTFTAIPGANNYVLSTSGPACNFRPVANDDSYSTNEDTVLRKFASAGVLANDTDNENSVLTAILVSGPSHGALTFNANGSFTYTPNDEFIGTDSFTYTANDGTLDSNVATVTITVNAVNDPPKANNDSATVDEDSGATAIDVLANDSTAPDTGETLTITAVTLSAHGSVAITGGGTGVTYTPNANFSGADGFNYSISDGNSTETAHVSVTVNPLNDAPDAQDDNTSVTEDSGANPIDVLANDTFAPDAGETLTVTAATQATNGTVAITGGGTGLSYTPNANFNGSDSFTYTISDGNGGTDTATVNVNVTTVNDPPDAVDDAVTVAEDSGAINISVLANDSSAPDTGETLTVTAVTQGANGTVAITSGGSGVSYTPAAHFFGPDSFTYTISDGNGGSDTATVNVIVTAVNDLPVALNDSYTTGEDSILTVNSAGGLLANDSDVDSSTLTALLVNGPTNGTLGLNPDGSFSYTPNPNFFGTDGFTYRAQDGQADSNVASVVITVNALNDAPDAVEDEVTTEEDTAVNIPLLANDTDADNDSLAVHSVTQGSNGAVVNNPEGTVTYTPNGNFNGNDSFTYTLSDGNGGTDTTTVNVTVTPVNDAPAAVDDQANTDEDTAVQIAVRANDADVDGGDALTVVAVAQGTSGAVVINPDGTVSYTPNANFNGSDSFTYTIEDGNGGSSSATVNVTIAPINDPPDAVNDTASVQEDSGVNAINVLVNDSFAPDTGETLTVTAVTQGASGAVAITGAGTGVSYTPNGNFNGSDAFDYTISDGSGGTDTATVTITANAVNDAPVAVNDSYSTNEDNPLVVGAAGVLSNDSDVDGDALTAALISGPSNGALMLNPNGSFTYTPAANFFGTDSFTYKVGDGALDSNTATVTITINAVNDPPDALNDSATTNQNTAIAISVLANDTDVEGHTLTVTAVTQGANGGVIINPDGTVTYTPNAGFSGADSFTYTISDGFGGSDTSTVNVNVNPSGQSALSRFVAFSREMTWLLNGTKVFTGDVGANTSLSVGPSPYDDDEDRDRRREVRIGEEVKMLQSSSKVVGDTIWLRHNSQVFGVHYNELINKHGTVLGLSQQPLPLPLLTMPELPLIIPGTQDIEVKKNKTHTIAPGRYRKITVQHGGTLILTGGIYHLSTLDVRTSAKVVFRGTSEVRIKNEMDTDARSYIGPDSSVSGLDASDIIFYVAGGDDKGRRHEDDLEPGYREEEVSPTVVQIGVENTIKANIYAPNGTVWIKKGGKATGAFIGKRARIGVRVELTLDSAF
ncbi:MAG TPA: Ig-like domain-containing protein [Pyrinomonadaceae bacterium]